MINVTLSTYVVKYKLVELYTRNKKRASFELIVQCVYTSVKQQKLN